MTGAAGSTRSYRPGDWFAVLGARTTLLLPPSERARVLAVWELVDGDADADEVLDALLADGLRRLPAFVLATTAEDGSTRLLVRGPVRVTVAADGETTGVDGASATTWVERSWVRPVSLSVVLDDRAVDPDLLVADGLVRVSRIEQPARSASPVADAGTEVTDLSALATPRAPAGRDDDTRTGEVAAVPPHPSLPGIHGQPPAPPVTARPVARLVMSHGESVDVDRAVLVGRAPEARRSTEAERPRLVAVPSPQQEISSTHLEVRPGSGADHGLAVVTDLGSTNGTVLVQPGLDPEDLRPGVTVQLVPGAVIDLGDGLTIEVHRP